MPKLLPINMRRPVLDLGKWIFRMLVGISGEGAQRLQLTDRLDPCANACAMAPSPRLNSETNLSGPQK